MYALTGWHQHPKWVIKSSSFDHMLAEADNVDLLSGTLSFCLIWSSRGAMICSPGISCRKESTLSTTLLKMNMSVWNTHTHIYLPSSVSTFIIPSMGSTFLYLSVSYLYKDTKQISRILHRWQHKRVGLKFDNKQLQQTHHNLEISINEGVDKHLYSV